MKKLILFSLLFLVPFLAQSQKDFDYTIYTTKATHEVDTSEQKLDISVLRKFKKEGNTLKVVSLVNTGDAVEYKLQYLGVQFEKDACAVFQYKIIERDGKPVDQAIISINPVTPSVIISATGNKASFY